jgi:splicing factor 3B subunit 2
MPKRKRNSRKRRGKKTDNVPIWRRESIAVTQSKEAEDNEVQVDVALPEDDSTLKRAFERLTRGDARHHTPSQQSEGNAAKEKEESGSKNNSEKRKKDDDENVDVKSKRRVREERETRRLAYFKMKSMRPDLIARHDMNSRDVALHVNLNTEQRNLVGVPSHWEAGKRYLQRRKLRFDQDDGGGGDFVLPPNIEATGIATMRAAHVEAAESKTSAQIGREQVRGKMGKLMLDYDAMYDAFFKSRYRPPMSGHGQVFDEERERERASAGQRRIVPGLLSTRLRAALGMRTPLAPPPWLFQMQRIGPPPAYPSLRIPGVNAPIPPGASWGFQAGQWGAPPLDARGQPMFTPKPRLRSVDAANANELSSFGLWGRIKIAGDDEHDQLAEGDDEAEQSDSDSSSSSSSSSDDESDDSDDDDDDDNDSDSDDDEEKQQRSLYRVLDEQKRNIDATSVMGSDRQYVVASAEQQQRDAKRSRESDAEPSSSSTAPAKRQRTKKKRTTAADFKF